jgi:hypothetical protein
MFKTLKTVLALINKLYCCNNSREFFPGGHIYNLCTDVVAVMAHPILRLKKWVNVILSMLHETVCVARQQYLNVLSR